MNLPERLSALEDLIRDGLQPDAAIRAKCRVEPLGSWSDCYRAVVRDAALRQVEQMRRDLEQMDIRAELAARRNGFGLSDYSQEDEDAALERLWIDMDPEEAGNGE